MHEYVYADRILQSVLDETKERAGRVKRVKVEVGELLGLTRESLGVAYEILAKGTRAEGSRLSVRFARGSVMCEKCGFSGRLPVHGHEHRIDPAFICPKCGASLKVAEGLEVRISEIE